MSIEIDGVFSTSCKESHCLPQQDPGFLGSLLKGGDLEDSLWTTRPFYRHNDMNEDKPQQQERVAHRVKKEMGRGSQIERRPYRQAMLLRPSILFSACL